MGVDGQQEDDKDATAHCRENVDQRGSVKRGDQEAPERWPSHRRELADATSPGCRVFEGVLGHDVGG